MREIVLRIIFGIVTGIVVAIGIVVFRPQHKVDFIACEENAFYSKLEFYPDGHIKSRECKYNTPAVINKLL